MDALTSERPSRRPRGGRVGRTRPVAAGLAVLATAVVLAARAAPGLAAEVAPPSGPVAARPPSAGAAGRDGAPPGAGPVDALEAEAARSDTTSAETLKVVPESVEVTPRPSAWMRRSECFSQSLSCAPSFVKDSDLRLRLRSFVFDRRNPDDSDDEAWALGGWFQYASGWAWDVFSIGGTQYFSHPLWAPEDSDGTSILAPGQEAIDVLGQAWARVRWRDYAVLTAYRQSIDEGYLNPQDNRMIPNTFEGVTVKGKVGCFAYDTGYVWGVKPRNREEFLSMSEQAGDDGPDEGLWLGALTWTPAKAWELYAAEYYLPELYNTAFARAKFTPTIRPGLDGRFGAQWTDQRSVGDERLGDFATWNVGLAAGLQWKRGLRIGAAAHVTGDDASIRSPYGTWPGWLSMIEIDFDRAGEKALGIAASWDFGAGTGPQVPGLTARAAYVQGVDRIDAATGDDLPTTREIDVDVIWDVPAVRGLQLRLRNAWVDSDGDVTGFQVRFLVNYEIEFL